MIFHLFFLRTAGLAGLIFIFVTDITKKSIENNQNFCYKQHWKLFFQPLKQLGFSILLLPIFTIFIIEMIKILHVFRDVYQVIFEKSLILSLK